MKKHLLTILLATLTWSTSTLAQKISIGPLHGQVYNYSQYKTSDFRIEYNLNCHDLNNGFLGGGKESYANHKLNLNEDGTYELPKLTVTKDFIASVCYLEIIFDLNNVKSTSSFPSRNSSRFYYSEDKIATASGFENFTIFEVVPQKMNYVTKSGKTSEEFIKGLGRDSILNLSFDFSKNETDVNNHRNYEISTTGYDKIESIARSDAKILFVPGLRSASEKVQVTTSLTRDFAATSQALVEFAENFPAAVTDLSVNDILVPYPRRTINGNWYVDMKFVRYNSWYPVESHFMHNAKMNLNCNAGIVSGTLTLNYRPPMQETVNLAGTCKDNDEAVVTMLLKHLEDMPAEPITFYIDRVEGSSMLYRSFFTSRPEVAPYEIPKDDLSMFLGLFNANGDCVGGFSAKSTP